MEQNINQEKPTDVSHSTTHEVTSGYCPLEAGRLRRERSRISSFDPDVNWENVKGADEEN
jgi:hypothetical protein